MRELTDDERDSYAEHFYGYGPLPGVGARDPEPTDDAEMAYGRRMLAWADHTNDEDGVPVCEFCEVAVPDGASDYPPFCSQECEQAASRETYASVHPRPEEVLEGVVPAQHGATVEPDEFEVFELDGGSLRLVRDRHAT
jgi:hypothetical protein